MNLLVGSYTVHSFFASSNTGCHCFIEWDVLESFLFTIGSSVLPMKVAFFPDAPVCDYFHLFYVGFLEMPSLVVA